MNELPSPALTRRFLALCEQYGSQRLAIQVVAVGRSTGVEGLPASDDWNTWDAGETQAAVDYLRRKRGLTADPAVPVCGTAVPAAVKMALIAPSIAAARAEGAGTAVLKGA